MPHKYLASHEEGNKDGAKAPHNPATHRGPAPGPLGGDPSLLALQRAAGNQAVVALLRRQPAVGKSNVPLDEAVRNVAAGVARHPGATRRPGLGSGPTRRSSSVATSLRGLPFADKAGSSGPVRLSRKLDDVPGTLLEDDGATLAGLVDRYNRLGRSPEELLQRNLMLNRIEGIVSQWSSRSLGVFNRGANREKRDFGRLLESQLAGERAEVGKLGGTIHESAMTFLNNRDKRHKAADKTLDERFTSSYEGTGERKKGTRAPAKKLAIGDEHRELLTDVTTRSKVETTEKEDLVEIRGIQWDSKFGFQKKGDNLQVSVNIPFSGETGTLPDIEKSIDKYWNVFKLSWKNNKHKNPGPAVKEVTLDFRLAQMSGKAGTYGFDVEAAHPVVLWKGDHPAWKTRVHLSESDAKTRSDAHNWRMEGDGMEKMVAHEFGHLIGLPDEYSRTHTDLKKATGKTPLGLQDSGNLQPQYQAGYTQLERAIRQAKTAKDLEALNTTLAQLYYQKPSPLLLYAEHFRTRNNQFLDDALSVAADNATSSHQGKMTTAEDNFTKARTIKAKVKLTQLRSTLQSELANVTSARDNLKWVSHHSKKGFASGGLMGDYTLLTTKTAEDRPNAVAHDHTHPLEPRHVKKFAESFNKMRQEEWEVTHR